MAKIRRSKRVARAAGTRTRSTAAPDLEVKIERIGPTPDELARARRGVLADAGLKRLLGRARSRLLALDLVDEPDVDKQEVDLARAKRFRATVYDYDNDRTIFARGSVAAPRDLELEESALQPLPSAEEFAEAVACLGRDPDLGPALRAKRLKPYRPVPPILGADLLDGRRRRAIAVGLLPRDPADHMLHAIVGIDLARSRVMHFAGGAPCNTRALGGEPCGLPDAAQPTIRSAPGSVLVTVLYAGQVVWRFVAVRPAGSSGTNGSGIELRYVDYRGRRVLYRGHVPFLNVKYDGDACGPYRDWQNEEGMLKAVGTDVAPGFRLCSSPATTVLDTGNDTGNFLGTAVYVKGTEVVLVSEMEAGWYRYVSEWRLDVDGTIRPRFGFGAVSSSCVCNRHHHHVYWRLDFDIGTPSNNLVREYNDPPIIGTSNWHDKLFEIRRSRDPSRNRRWRVVNTGTGHGYDIIPGPTDGVASAMPDAPFGVGDFWVTRYRPTEIDDGVVAIGPPYEVDIDRWVNGESVKNTDVVVWYGAHFTHDLHEEPEEVHGHIVGPTLRPVRRGFEPVRRRKPPGRG
jgi:hypothetical protein